MKELKTKTLCDLEALSESQEKPTFFKNFFKEEISRRNLEEVKKTTGNQATFSYYTLTTDVLEFDIRMAIDIVEKHLQDEKHFIFKSLALKNICEKLVLTKQWELAMHVAETIPNHTQKGQAHQKIAKGLVKDKNTLHSELKKHTKTE